MDSQYTSKAIEDIFKERERVKIAREKELRKLRNRRYYLKKKAKDIKSGKRAPSKRDLEEERNIRQKYKEFDETDFSKSTVKRRTVKDRGTYLLLKTTNQRKSAYMSKAYSLEGIMKKYNVILEEANKHVVFPRKYNMPDGIPHRVHYELVIIKRRNEFDPSYTVLKDFIGLKRYVYVSDNPNYIIVAKANYPVEEMFAVSGHHNFYDRKTFMWICKELVETFLRMDGMLRVLFFKNKLYLDYNLQRLEVVTCKTRDDAVRFYNMLIDRYCDSEKMFFAGEMERGTRIYTIMTRRELELEHKMFGNDYVTKELAKSFSLSLIPYNEEEFSSEDDSFLNE